MSFMSQYQTSDVVLEEVSLLFMWTSYRETNSTNTTVRTLVSIQCKPLRNTGLKFYLLMDTCIYLIIFN